MTTPTTRLGLAKPTTGDNYSVAGLDAVYDAIDAQPGLHICTSGTRPGAWGVNQTGRTIIETDTGLIWRWNGTAFVRQGPSGWLGGNRRTADYSVVDGAYGVVVQQTGIVVPAGGRRVLLTLGWNHLDLASSGGSAEWGLFEGSTQLVAWEANLHGGSYSYHYAPAAGVYTFSAQLKGLGSAGTLRADATHPCSIDIVEE